jgi:hypothetical protein
MGRRYGKLKQQLQEFVSRKKIIDFGDFAI